MNQPVVIGLLSEKQLFFGNQILADFSEMQRSDSPFRFDVGFVCNQLAVKLIMVEINEVQDAAEHSLSKIGLVAGFVQHIHYQVRIFFTVELHSITVTVGWNYFYMGYDLSEEGEHLKSIF